MKVTDASAIANQVYIEMVNPELPEGQQFTVDASNIVDVGKTLFNLNQPDVIFRAITDRIGKLVIRNKTLPIPSRTLFRDGWDFGNILQALRIRDVEATPDPSYNPVDGQNYPLTTFKKMDVVQHFYQDYDNFQIEYWRPTDQLWTAFNSLEELTRFFTGIEIAVQNSLSVRIQGLINIAVANMIASTIHSEASTGTPNIRVVRLLTRYNETAGTSLTADQARRDDEFLRFTSKTIAKYKDWMNRPYTGFNIAGELEFTSDEDMVLQITTDFAKSMEFYLYGDTYHDSFVNLPNYETVPYWQAFGDISDGLGDTEKLSIRIKTGDGQGTQATTVVEQDHIVGIMFDREAVAVNCEKKKLTSFYHPDLDQTKFFDKYLAQYINAFDKNFVVFILE